MNKLLNLEDKRESTQLILLLLTGFSIPFHRNISTLLLIVLIVCGIIWNKINIRKIPQLISLSALYFFTAGYILITQEKQYPNPLIIRQLLLLPSLSFYLSGEESAKKT
jgi:hypothetical protein